MRELRIALVGHRGIGRVHALGYREVRAFFELELQPVLSLVCGRDEARARAAADRQGWREWSSDWQRAVERSDIDLVDICTPNSLHAPIAVAAARAGKHVVCEKPLSTSLANAISMLAEARRARVHHMTAFTFRCVPAIRLARELIEEGRVGEVRRLRASWLSDLVDPALPLSWFYRADAAGYGASGDLGSHLIDLAHYLVGPMSELVAETRTFTAERPLPPDDVEREAASARREADGRARAARRTGRVDVDDAAIVLARFERGAIGTFEATRGAGGHREEFDVEIHGSRGTLGFNSNRFNELRLYDAGEDARLRAARTLFVGSSAHPYGESICPYGEVIGRSDLFIIQAYELLSALAHDVDPQPSFVDGARCQAVLDAIVESARTRAWVRPDYAAVDRAVQPAP